MDAAAPKLRRDHEPQGVHQQTVVRLLHPFGKGDLLREKHRIGLHAGQHVLDGHALLEPAFFAEGKDEALLHMAPLSEGDQYVVAGANVEPRGHPVGERPIHGRVGDIHDHFGEHAAPPFPSVFHRGKMPASSLGAKRAMSTALFLTPPWRE